MATKSYVHGRIEGEVNSQKGREDLKKHLEALEAAGKILEERGYRPEKGEVTKNDDLGIQVVKKSWTK